jgi:hypothetical protein
MDHPVPGMEVLAGMSQQLAIAGVIDGFDTDHFVHQVVVVLVDVLDQPELGARLAPEPGRVSSAEARTGRDEVSRRRSRMRLTCIKRARPARRLC